MAFSRFLKVVLFVHLSDWCLTQAAFTRSNESHQLVEFDLIEACEQTNRCDLSRN